MMFKCPCGFEIHKKPSVTISSRLTPFFAKMPGLKEGSQYFAVFFG